LGGRDEASLSLPTLMSVLLMKSGSLALPGPQLVLVKCLTNLIQCF